VLQLFIPLLCVITGQELPQRAHRVPDVQNLDRISGARLALQDAGQRRGLDVLYLRRGAEHADDRVDGGVPFVLGSDGGAA
jgi:hypothetical protein